MVLTMGDSPMKLKYLAGACLSLAQPAHAGPFAEDLGRCVVNATTEADRSALMRWMFVAVAGNPVFADIVDVTSAQRQQATRAAAAVFDRLLLRACRRESMLALRHEGNGGLEAGFRALGMVAGREMMSTPEGSVSLGELTNSMDSAGMEALAREAGDSPSPQT
jgi:hypothetical protein